MPDCKKVNHVFFAVVRGDTETSVKAACIEIHLVLEAKRSLMHPTHFLSIPVDSECIKLAFEEFMVVLYSVWRCFIN
jgi:hypothetical protein